MAIHPSLKSADKDKKARSVLKRTERLKTMMEKKMWKEGDDVFGLPKIKTIRIKIKKEKPDIIIMDVRLPDMRGSVAARILRQDKDASSIPIVFVTASVMVGEREEINAITNSGFIGKPINTRTFAKEISQFIKGRG